jgi:uncharacterized membrane protein (DUF373 family)
MDPLARPKSERLRHVVTTSLHIVEDIVYIGLGLLLAAIAIWLLLSAAWTFVHTLVDGTFTSQIVNVLDQILLVLLIIEVLYTVVLSFRQHSLTAEPFLVVALIAIVRKILVLTARIADLPSDSESTFRHYVIELGVFGLLLLVLVISLILMQRHARQAATQQRAES